MINTTDRPVPLVDGTILDREIRQSLAWAEERIREEQDSTSLRPHQKSLFSGFLGKSNQRIDSIMDSRFLQAMYDFACSDAQNTTTRPAIDTMAEKLCRRTVPASAYPQVKRGIKITLVELWRRQALLLPTVFCPGTKFPMLSVDHEIIRWLQSFNPNSLDGFQRSSNRRLYMFGPRLLFATNWKRIEDVSITEISRLHLAQLKYACGRHPYAIAGSAFPWSQLPAELLAEHPGRVTFTKSDLARYSAWSARHATVRGEYEDFSTNSRVGSTSPPRARHSAKRPTADDVLATEAKAAATHDAVLAYYKRLSRRPESADWRKHTPLYPGREHVALVEASALWIQSFDTFLYHRENIQGYRSEDEIVASLNILADYLFLYLPWWRELFPASLVGIPVTPRDFGRYEYVGRHKDEAIEKLPVPLLKMVRLRRPNAFSATICIKHLARYFRFVGAHFSDDDRVAGGTFRNPIEEEFDAPRSSGKRHKTNKEIIPRNIYGYLLFYCYAVEKFGQHLLQKAIAGELESHWFQMRNLSRYDTEKFGITPVVCYRGAEFPLRSVPNVFT